MAKQKPRPETRTSARSRGPLVRVLLVFAALAILVGVALALWQSQNSGSVASRAIGGPFTLTDQNGATVTEAALKGHPSLVFFGYTFCPDVCPTTLLSATNWLKALGPDGDRLKVYFVTVDPERDTVAQLKAYLSAFDPRIEGLTGPRSALDPMLKSYFVYSKKVGSGDDYAMDHTASLYLIDANGNLAGTLDYQADEETALAKLKALIAG